MTVGARRSNGAIDTIVAENEAQAKGRMTILVKSQVTQTYGEDGQVLR